MVITFYNVPDDAEGPERSNEIHTPHAQLTYNQLRFREDGIELATYDQTLGRWVIEDDFAEFVGGTHWTDVVIGAKPQ